jgi:hypothetical protein
MKVFLAGATGAIGQHLVPELITAGHEVVGTTRSEAKTGRLTAAGATPVVLDALDREAVVSAVTAAEPDVVIHQLTAIESADFKNFDESFAATNKLRTAGLDHLLEAARTVGAKRFIAQSYTGWPNERVGDLEAQVGNFISAWPEHHGIGPDFVSTAPNRPQAVAFSNPHRGISYPVVMRFNWNFVEHMRVDLGSVISQPMTIVVIASLYQRSWTCGRMSSS